MDNLESHVVRILEVADALATSAGKDNAAGSTSEQIAAALLCNRADWTGYGHVLDALDRLGPEWTRLIIEARKQAHRTGYKLPA